MAPCENPTSTVASGPSPDVAPASRARRRRTPASPPRRARALVASSSAMRARSIGSQSRSPTVRARAGSRRAHAGIPRRAARRAGAGRARRRRARGTAGPVAAARPAGRWTISASCVMAQMPADSNPPGVISVESSAETALERTLFRADLETIHVEDEERQHDERRRVGRATRPRPRAGTACRGTSGCACSGRRHSSPWRRPARAAVDSPSCARWRNSRIPANANVAPASANAHGEQQAGLGAERSRRQRSRRSATWRAPRGRRRRPAESAVPVSRLFLFVRRPGDLPRFASPVVAPSQVCVMTRRGRCAGPSAGPDLLVEHGSGFECAIGLASVFRDVADELPSEVSGTSALRTTPEACRARAACARVPRHRLPWLAAVATRCRVPAPPSARRASAPPHGDGRSPCRRPPVAPSPTRRPPCSTTQSRMFPASCVEYAAPVTPRRLARSRVPGSRPRHLRARSPAAALPGTGSGLARVPRRGER